MGHDSGACRTDAFRTRIARIAEAPRGRQRVASQLADAFLQVIESIGRLRFPAPFDFACIDIDCPKRNRSGIDFHAAWESIMHSEDFPGSHFRIGEYHKTRSHQFSGAQDIGFQILIAVDRYLLIGRRLHEFCLIDNQNSPFKQPGAHALDSIRARAPDHRPRIRTGKFGVIPVRNRCFDGRIALAARDEAEQQEAAQYSVDKSGRNVTPRLGCSLVHRG